MANFTFGALQPTALTNLNATATGLTVSFTWDQQGNNEKVEVWKGSTTTRTNSTLVAATWDHNFQESENAGAATAYYWLRKVNTLQGGQYGPWSAMITVTITGATAVIADGSISTAKLAGNAVNSVKMDKSVVTYNGGGYGHMQYTSNTVNGTVTYTLYQDGGNYAALSGFNGSVSLTSPQAYTGAPGQAFQSPFNSDGSYKHNVNGGGFDPFFDLGTYQFTGGNVGVNLEIGASVDGWYPLLQANNDIAELNLMIYVYDNTTHTSFWGTQFTPYYFLNQNGVITTRSAQKEIYRKIRYTQYDATQGTTNQLIFQSGHSYWVYAQWNVVITGSTSNVFTTYIKDFYGSITFTPL